MLWRGSPRMPGLKPRNSEAYSWVRACVFPGFAGALTGRSVKPVFPAKSARGPIPQWLNAHCE